MTEVNLSYHEVEEVLESIITNKKLISLNSRQGKVFVVFSHPSSEEILQSRYIKEKSFIEARAADLPTVEEMQAHISQNNLRDPQVESKVKDLEEQISAQRRVLQITRIEGRRQPILDNISRLEGEVSKLQHQHDHLLYMTAEKKSEEAAFLFLVWASTHKVEGGKYWPSFDDFEKETDFRIMSSIRSEFLTFNSGVPLSVVRYLARHNLWRIRYNSALKLGGSLFKRDLHDLTTDQLALLYWSNYYQSLYEMLPDDQPDEETIKDDEALDAFMEDYFKRKEQERKEGRAANRSKGTKRGKLSAWEKGEELIITPAHPDYMTMDYSENRVKSADGIAEVEVISPNSRRARNRLSSRNRR